MKRICPNCHTISTSIRCPQCGADTVPMDDIRKEPPSGYTIFQHAQAGHTPTSRHEGSLPSVKPWRDRSDAAQVRELMLQLQLGDCVTFEATDYAGATKHVKGHLLAIDEEHAVLTVFLTEGVAWKIYVREVLEVTRHCIPNKDLPALQARGWQEDPKGRQHG